MENIRQYDQFILEIEKKLNKRPVNKSGVLLEIIGKIQCPYIREKIKQIMKEKYNQKS